MLTSLKEAYQQFSEYPGKKNDLSKFSESQQKHVNKSHIMFASLL